MSAPTPHVNYRLQLVAWIKANEQAAQNSPQNAQWSKGVAAGVKLALDLLDKQGMPAVAELIEAAEDICYEVSDRSEGKRLLVQALARVKGVQPWTQ